MKAALKSQFVLPLTSVTVETRRELLQHKKPVYLLVTLSQPHNQDGNDFYFIVAPFKFTDEMKGIQNGAGVLCQTEAEAKETFENLTNRAKKHLVSFQAAGFGAVGWASNLRRLVNEIGLRPAIAPDGRKVWLAFEAVTDQDTLEETLIRCNETDNEAEAIFWKGKWLAEYNQKKKVSLDAMAKSIAPPPPPRCTPLTKSELEDLGKAKMIAMQKQWPRCFEIFERTKSHPGEKIQDQKIEDAYLLDLVENGGEKYLKSAEGGKVRADGQLIAALHKAAQNYARRGKSKITDAAIYFIAFNWELGWCYLSDEQIAGKLGEILETPFTPGQAKQYRYRTLELVAKHPPGPPPNLP